MNENQEKSLYSVRDENQANQYREGIYNAIDHCSDSNAQALMNYCVSHYGKIPYELEGSDLAEMHAFAGRVLIINKTLGISKSGDVLMSIPVPPGAAWDRVMQLMSKGMPQGHDLD